MSNPSFVVVGGGLAAGKAVEELREAGFDGEIVLFGTETHRPYERPPLSKGYLMGNDPLDSAFLQPPEWYADQRVDLRLGTTVTGIDRDAHEVVTDTGRQRYDKLLLATGSSPRHLALADDSGAPVAYLRTIEDSERLKQAFADHRRLVVIGGGWIGLEVAAAGREADCDVTVLETLDLPLLRVLGPEVARVFADLHREHGVDLRTGIEITGIEGDADHVVVRLADGSTAEGDLLLVGIGAAPNDGLARDAGLETDDGVLTDATLASSDPDVFAAGDLANADHPVLGRRLRVEHWDNAIEQGKVAARNMLGQGVGYDRMPYFYTDQYDLGCEYIGNVGPDGYDEVVLRGDVDKRVFTAFWVQGDRVLAGMQVNDWDATDAVRALVGRTVDPARLRDENVPLTEI